MSFARTKVKLSNTTAKSSLNKRLNRFKNESSGLPSKS